jgi:hypothetical protein
MASTLTPTTFKIQITEEQIVRNSVNKNEITYTIPNVSNVDHRILTCPATTSIDLFNLNGVNPGAGTFPSSSLKYARISNLDDTTSIAITVSGSHGGYTQEILPVSTIFIVSPNITSSLFSSSFGDTIQSVSAYAMTGNADIEYTLINA